MLVCLVHLTGPRVQVPAVVRAMAVPALKAMLVSGTEAEHGVGSAMVAMRAICAAPEGRDSAVAAGVPAVLTAVMSARDATARCDAVYMLLKMCVNAWARVCGGVA